ncbi:uncharacterized protein LMH87_007577 [Akanthomyces muscarius]|uniref:Uncharacterized protein n=1 Tax=Akanthomyces muscarius TaxID=2231603 RepID=A0A9W8UNL1_AKAMU|nr:uncharacterized protein LMH87_007577 [Akanthomyces muscarius]KAJ4161543.1 hypothetical protein LMH87_007577 [Akanthomyces muscarius]
MEPDSHVHSFQYKDGKFHADISWNPTKVKVEMHTSVGFIQIPTLQLSESRENLPKFDTASCNAATNPLLPASDLANRREATEDNMRSTGSTDGIDDNDGNDLSNSGECVEIRRSDMVTVSNEELCDVNGSNDMRNTGAVGATGPLPGVESNEKAGVMGEIGRLGKGSDLVQSSAQRRYKLRVGVNLQKLASDHQ